MTAGADLSVVRSKFMLTRPPLYGLILAPLWRSASVRMTRGIYRSSNFENRGLRNGQTVRYRGGNVDPRAWLTRATGIGRSRGDLLLPDCVLHRLSRQSARTTRGSRRSCMQVRGDTPKTCFFDPAVRVASLRRLGRLSWPSGGFETMVQMKSAPFRWSRAAVSH